MLIQLYTPVKKVTIENKANALSHVIGDEEKIFELYPAQLINPIDGKLDWLWINWPLLF